MKNSMRPGFYSSLLLLAIEACSDSTQFKATGVADGIINETPPAQADAKAAESGSNSDPASTEPRSASNKNNEAATASTVTESNATIPSNPISIPQTAADRYKQQCSTANKKTLTQRIKFPETANCRFDQAGNLGRRDAYLQAVEGQHSLISLPDKSQLCDLGVSSPSATIQYDDFMILTLNGYVLLSSNNKILSNLETSSSSAYQWDFSRIRGSAVDFNAPAYCLGSGSSLCVVPETDVPGKFQFNIDPSSLIKLADKVIDNNLLDFTLLATGDNDDRDCWHTEVTLDFTLQYVEIP